MSGVDSVKLLRTILKFLSVKCKDDQQMVRCDLMASYNSEIADFQSAWFQYFPTQCRIQEG